MNSTKFFFLIIFFFSTQVVSYAQAELNTISPEAGVTTTSVTEDSMEETIVAIIENNAVTTESNTTLSTGSNITNTTSSPSNDYVFYFNHKQFMRPIVRKTALC